MSNAGREVRERIWRHLYQDCRHFDAPLFRRMRQRRATNEAVAGWRRVGRAGVIGLASGWQNGD